MRMIAATNNPDKVREIREILAGTGLEVISQREAGIAMDVEETGTSFEENALLKARSIHARTGGLVMADDSGLAIDALGGAPGIHSARFAGEGAGYPEKIARIHAMLEGVPESEWTARFICVVAVVRPDGSAFTVRGTCEGRIAREAAGTNGFGYDPVFYLPEFGRTCAQLDPDEKHRVSHRGHALRAMLTRFRCEGLVTA